MILRSILLLVFDGVPSKFIEIREFTMFWEQEAPTPVCESGYEVLICILVVNYLRESICLSLRSDSVN